MTTHHGNLLVVDDNEMNRDMLSRRLSRQGHTVVTAENGQKTLELIEQQPFDVILLDIMMPGISGIEVLKLIRQSYSASELPVIMVTANGGAVPFHPDTHPCSIITLLSFSLISRPILNFTAFLAGTWAGSKVLGF